MHRKLGPIAFTCLAVCSCTYSVGSQHSSTSTATGKTTRSSVSAPATSAAPTAAPGADASLADVVAWIAAGTELTDPNSHIVTQTYQTPVDSAPTTTIALGAGVVFRSPSEKIHCVGGASADEPFTCAVHLVNPPPKPDEAPIAWHGDWVSYTGDTAQVGAYQGGCSALKCYGPSDGPTLPYGEKMSWDSSAGHYTCRMDVAGLYCANESKGSAILLNDQGVRPYGCLKPDATEKQGIAYKC